MKTKRESLPDKKYSSDSSKDIWEEYYEPFYNNIGWEFWNIFDYRNLDGGKNERYYAKCREESEKYGKTFIKCKLGGETDFNFNHKKYKRYEQIISKDNNDVLNLLRECEERQHRRCNFSLFITTGGLNSLKGRLSQEQCRRSLDRFDVFVFVLNDYFQNRKVKEDYMHIIFSEAWHNAKENRECLYKYLRLFKDIEDYFEKNYNINDKRLIQDLIESGSKAIDSENRVVEYLELAKQYWKAKENGIKEVLSKVKGM